ncbi:hypothetical protein NLU13_0745 [Sarocladium strictum]|uniref:Glutathione S-transferase n=1 Tax=Sarocladium strictum TaxID=5046 RepID=A0AA39GQD7_SARSR|nr:hypothetical protein NLU13_0745 [Sarocladium strictum]
MADIKPITVYNHPSGPNPKKVFIVLEELELPYEKIDISDPKADSFTSTINPNGRLPAIKDPNTDILLWESGAIIEYLIEKYDKEGKLTPAGDKDKWLAKQYLFFQVSGQGPYYGQMVWYNYFDKNNPEAKKRYDDQVERVIMVLNSILKGKKYLVSDTLYGKPLSPWRAELLLTSCHRTYADLSFVPWTLAISGFKDIMESWEVEKKYPDYLAWHARLLERPSVRKVYGLDKSE